MLDIDRPATEGPLGGGLLVHTTWDCRAAGRAGVETIAVLTGGFSADELRRAGAIAVYESIAELRASLDETPLA